MSKYDLNHQKIFRSKIYNVNNFKKINNNNIHKLYEFMLRLRMCEEALAKEYHPADEMKCPVHFCIGQESIPAALNLLMKKKDYLFSHHRSHGFFLAKRSPMKKLFAELYGKVGGANGGIAGSQDISYPENNFYSGAILAGSISIAVGTALANKLDKNNKVVFACFGESATDEGIFWEAINYSVLEKLPIIFVCENNNYSVFSPQSKRQSGISISMKVKSFGINTSQIFGNDVALAFLSIKDSIKKIKKGPSFIEAFTSRWSGHYGPESDDFVNYRHTSDLSFYKKNCPIKILEKNYKIDNKLKLNYQKIINNEIKNSFMYAKKSPFPKKINWENANFSNKNILSKKILKNIESKKIKKNLNLFQPKGY